MITLPIHEALFNLTMLTSNIQNEIGSMIMLDAIAEDKLANFGYFLQNVSTIEKIRKLQCLEGNMPCFMNLDYKTCINSKCCWSICCTNYHVSTPSKDTNKIVL